MASNFIFNSKKKVQSMSRAQVLISFTAFAVLLSSIKAYGMDPSDPDTLFVMSNRYAQGHGVEKNDEQALNYLKAAADQGHAKANFKLGERYEEDGDEELASKHYQIAADLGDPEAQNELGLSFLLEKDIERGLKYLNLAADQGDIRALIALGNIYSTDKFVPHDYQKTLRYLTSKPIREYVPSLDQEDLSHHVRTNLYAVGRLYNDGIVVAKDLGMAFQYYKLAADLGYPEAQLSLGAAYFAGAGVTMDAGMGLYYYKLSANQGCAEAQYVMGQAWEQNAISLMIALDQLTEKQKILLRHDSKPKASAPTSNSPS